MTAQIITLRPPAEGCDHVIAFSDDFGGVVRAGDIDAIAAAARQYEPERYAKIGGEVADVIQAIGRGWHPSAGPAMTAEIIPFRTGRSDAVLYEARRVLRKSGVQIMTAEDGIVAGPAAEELLSQPEIECTCYFCDEKS